ncbi:hypothetical protein ACSBR2_025143 [Camellia fascicularis]
MVVRESPETTSIAVKSELQFSLFLMNMNPRGKERTKTQFQCLAKEAGFSTITVACRAYNFKLVEFHRKM